MGISVRPVEETPIEKVTTGFYMRLRKIPHLQIFYILVLQTEQKSYTGGGGAIIFFVIFGDPPRGLF